MAGIVLDQSGAAATRDAVDVLRFDFKVPADKVMSWKHHVKTHDRRRRAVEVLGQVQGLKVCYVYVVKDALKAGSYRDDHMRFYNYVAFKMYKSTIWAARSWKGPRARVWTRFGHVKHHDHTTTEAYIRLQSDQDARVPFEMEQGLRWVSAETYAESQAADLYAGFLKSALWPGGEFDYAEPAYLLGIWHQIRNSEDCAIPLGIMSMPDRQLLKQKAWFPCDHCEK